MLRLGTAEGVAEDVALGVAAGRALMDSGELFLLVSLASVVRMRVRGLCGRPTTFSYGLFELDTPDDSA